LCRAPNRRRPSMRRLASLVLLALVPSLALAQEPAEAKPEIKHFAGHWVGSIDLGAQKLAIDVDLRCDASAGKGDISIPAQNAKDLPLAKLAFSGEHAKFEIQGVPGEPTFDGKLAGEKKLSGDFAQGGQKFTFELTRGGGADEAKGKLAGFDA